MRAGRRIGWALSAGPVVAVLLRLPGAAWVAVLVYHAGCLFAAGLPGPGLGPRPRMVALLGIGLGTALVALLGMAVLRNEVPLLGQPVGAWIRWGMRAPADRAFLVYYALVNPWIEERFWRGALLGEEVRGRLGPRAARGLAILAFLPHHLAVLVPSFGAALGPALALPILLASWSWTELRLRSGGLWWSVASHLGADLGLSVAYAWWMHP